MQIVAKRNADGTWSQTLEGATANAIVELREQNTMNGVVRVHMVNVDQSGKGVITNPRDCGPHLVYSMRVLTDKDAPFTTFSNKESDNTGVTWDSAKPAASEGAKPDATAGVKE